MGFFCSGCYYEEYSSLAYPLSSFPSGGLWKRLPSFYMDYEEEFKKSESKRKQQRQDEYNERSKENTRNFFKSFFGWDLPEEPATLDEDYPYNVFGLKKSASQEDVKKAYRKEILKSHPDKGGSNELFRKIQEAWEYFKKVYQ
jgi:DnaJ-class molecular chaperone